MDIQIQTSALCVFPFLLVLGISVLYISKLWRSVITARHFQLCNLHCGSFSVAPIKVWRNKKIRWKLRTECDYSLFRCFWSDFTVNCRHLSELTVSEFHHHSCNGLCGTCRTRPHKHNTICICNAVFNVTCLLALVCVLQKCWFGAVFKWRNRTYTAPNLCSCTCCINFAVYIYIDSLVVLTNVFDRHGYSTFFNIKTITDIYCTFRLMVYRFKRNSLCLCNFTVFIF